VLFEVYEKVIDQMIVKDKIREISHDRIKPPEVYVSLKDPFNPDEAKALITVDTSDATG
jgi:hypothetical protein